MEKPSAKRPSSVPCSMLNSRQGGLPQFRALITSPTDISPAPNSTAEAGEGEGTGPARKAPAARGPARQAAREKASEETGGGPAQGQDGSSPRPLRGAPPPGAGPGTGEPPTYPRPPSRSPRTHLSRRPGASSRSNGPG